LDTFKNAEVKSLASPADGVVITWTSSKVQEEGSPVKPMQVKLTATCDLTVEAWEHGTSAFTDSVL
jgi:hypothetical protein